MVINSECLESGYKVLVFNIKHKLKATIHSPTGDYFSYYLSTRKI